MEALVAVLDKYPNNTHIVCNVLFALIVASGSFTINEKIWELHTMKIINKIVKEGGHMKNAEILDQVAGFAYSLCVLGPQKGSFVKLGLHVDFMSAISL